MHNPDGALQMTRNRIPLSPRRLLGAASFLALSLVLPASAEEEPRAFNIPAQPLSEAVMEFARQSKLNVVAPAHLTRGKTSRAISGEMDPRDALRLLMSDAPIDVRSGNDGAIILVQAVTDVPKPQTSPTADPATLPATPRDPAGTAGSQPTRSATLQWTNNREDEERTLGRVTVTGTSLRGFAPESSPLQVYSREDILASGVTTTDQFIRTLPQNFGGGSSEFAPNGIPGDDNVRFNNSFGTGANLRGLGSGATLTLLNGRRLAPTSRIGDFVDLSMIPFSALERVDVLSDGASAIYGGDAVAGVVNFVLRDDFDGAETSLRYGSVTKGRMEEIRFSQAFGRSWDSGNVLGTYEYFDRDALRLSDRPSIPLAPSMTGLSEFHNLFPSQTRHSALLSAHQRFGPSLEAALTGLYSERSTDNLTVSNAGSIEGAEAKSHIYSIAAGATYEVTPAWELSLDAVFSRTTSEDDGQRLAPNPTPWGGRRTVSELKSVDLVASGELFALAGGPVRAAIGGHLRQESLTATLRLPNAEPSDENSDERDIAALYAELFVPIVGAHSGAPGIRRLELNVSARLDEYSDFGSTVNPKVGVLWSPMEGINIRSSYSESFSPPALGRTGDLRRSAQVLPFATLLELVGRELPDPSLADVDYMQTSGTAGDLGPETSETWTLGIDHQGDAGDHRWTIRATYYDIAFSGRLGSTPRPGNVSLLLAPFIALENPDAFPEGTVIFNPDQVYIDQIASAFTRPPSFLYGATGLGNIGVVNNVSVVRNLASTETRGVDLDLGYERTMSFGEISAGLNANYIMDFRQQAASSTPSVQTLNTYLHPVDLQVRGRMGIKRDGLSGTLFINHTDSYRTDGTESAAKIAGWTTVDVTAAYSVGSAEAGWLNNTRFSVSVRNLLDEPPPRAPVNEGFRLAGYDPTNASPLMRFVAFEVSKAF